MNWETLLALGDSITIGSRSYLGYPEYAANYLAQHTHKHWSVHNCAVSRFTTIDLSRHVSTHYGSLSQLSPDVISIMVGTNDAKSPTSLDQFRIAYDQLIIKAQLINRESRLILLKIPALIEGVMLPYTQKMDSQINAYNKVIDGLAIRHSARTLALELSSAHFFDGVHLNELGSEATGKQLGQFILAERMMPS